MDFLDLLAVGDMNKAVSWNDDISAEELNSLRLKAYLTFHSTRMFYHPLLFINSFFNVLRNINETKTERTLIQFLKRLRIRNKTKNRELKTKTIEMGLTAYPYDSSLTIKTLLQSKPHYSYGHSLLQALRIWKNKTFNLKN